MAKAYKLALGGENRELRYDMNALADLEDALRAPLPIIGERLKRGKQGFRELRAIVWCGLLHADEELALREVGSWLTEAGFLSDDDKRNHITTVTFEALAAAFPEAAKAAEGADEAKGTSPNE